MSCAGGYVCVSLNTPLSSQRIHQSVRQRKVTRSILRSSGGSRASLRKVTPQTHLTEDNKHVAALTVEHRMPLCLRTSTLFIKTCSNTSLRPTQQFILTHAHMYCFAEYISWMSVNLPASTVRRTREPCLHLCKTTQWSSSYRMCRRKIRDVRNASVFRKSVNTFRNVGLSDVDGAWLWSDLTVWESNM